MVYEMAEENKSGLINKINLLSTQLNIHKQWVDFKNPFKFEWTSSLWIGIFQRAKQGARMLLTDNMQSGGSCSVN